MTQYFCLYFVGQVSQIITPKFYKEEKHNPLAGKKGEGKWSTGENGIHGQQKYNWQRSVQLLNT